MEDLRFQKGYVFYNGQDYYDVQMRYDLVEDQLIVNSKEHLNFFDVKLIQEKVQKFSINNKNFVFQQGTKNLEKGFYEIAYKNNEKVFLIKHKKTPKRRIEGSNVFYTFKENESYYLINGDAVSEVNDLESLRKILKNDWVDIKLFSKNNPQNKNESFRSYMIRLLEYLQKTN